mgnify:CR=1 FL=1
MNSTAKREVALKLLEATGIWKSSYAPPGVRLLWRLGFDCPPPHLARFWSVFLVCALYFGIFMGLFMVAMSTFSGTNVPSSSTLLGASLAGICFGLFMATYYAMGRRKYRLPLWKDLHAIPET